MLSGKSRRDSQFNSRLPAPNRSGEPANQPFSTRRYVTLQKAQSFHGVRFDGRTYDTGSKLGFLAANAAFALARPDIAPGFRAELKKLLGA